MAPMASISCDASTVYPLARPNDLATAMCSSSKMITAAGRHPAYVAAMPALITGTPVAWNPGSMSGHCPRA